MPRDELRDAVEDFAQSRWQWITRPRTNHATLDEGRESPPVAAHHAVSCVGRAGIDAEDEHLGSGQLLDIDIEIRPDLLDIVQLLDRFDEPEQRLGVAALDLYRCLRDHRELCFDDRKALGL